MKTKFPRFDSYACAGDSITWQAEGFDVTARIEYDTDCKPTDFDCYSPLKIKQWQNDQWFFCGLILSVSKNGVEITDHAASLWGLDCNYTKKSNRYLSEAAKELESEAINYANREATRMIAALA